MKYVFAFITLATALAGCAQTRPPADAALKGKPRIPVNQQPVPVPPASALSHPSGA